MKTEDLKDYRDIIGGFGFILSWCFGVLTLVDLPIKMNYNYQWQLWLTVPLTVLGLVLLLVFAYLSKLYDKRLYVETFGGK